MRLFVRSAQLIFFLMGAAPLRVASGQELLPPVGDLNGLRSLGLGIPAVGFSGLSMGETAAANPAWVGQEGKNKQKDLLRGLWFPSVTLGANGTTRALAKAYFSGQSSSQQRIESFLKAAQNEQTPFGYFALQPSMTLGLVQVGAFARVRVEGYVWQPTETTLPSDGGLTDFPTVSGGLSGRLPMSLTGTAAAAKMDVRATIERGTSLSFSIPYKNTGVFLGVTVRPMWRSDFFGSVSLAEPLVSETASSLKAKFNETKGYPIDVGATVRLPKFSMKPTFGLKIDDVTDTRFVAVSSAHQTLIQKSNLSAGVSAWVLQNAKFGTQCGLAGHHLNDSRLEWAGKWGGACEMHLFGQTEADVISGAPVILRLGGTQDGVAYGLSWDMPFTLVEIASTPARISGPAGTSTRQDRRYFLRLSVNVSQP